MRYKNVDDVKQKMKNMFDSIETSNEFYDEFKWFSKINYTTTTEYYGELRIFLMKVLEYKWSLDDEKELRELFCAINDILFPKN